MIEILEGSSYLPQIQELIREYTASLHRDLSFQGLQDELEDLRGKYSEPNGYLMAAVDDETKTVAGCVAYHKLSKSCCEMKRLYVKPEYRRLHIGRELVKTLLTRAMEDGYREMVLDTIVPLQSAIQLYRSLGFQETTAYYDNPMEDVIYMRKQLTEEECYVMQ